MVGGGGFTTVELNEGRTHLSAYWRETPLGIIWLQLLVHQ